ncbi:hypothetical protein GF362_06525 [Candidatus Dojkabacteria bacterium]|nr:hypothetical protein [Candidatus Dojkabacteria bacterium]
MKKINVQLIIAFIFLVFFVPLNQVSAEASGEIIEDGTVDYADIDPESDIVTECMGVFVDMNQADIFCPYAEYLYHQKVISGNQQREYMAENSLTRGALAKYVVNAFDIPIKLETEPFPDVSEDHTFYNYIMALKHAGIINGYSDGNYKPDRYVTRGELSKFIVNVTESEKPDLFANICVCEKITLEDGESIYACPKCAKDVEVFPDVTFENVFYTYIIKLYSATKDDNNFLKIIGGYSDGTFRPEANVTRGQVAKIVANTMKFGSFRNIKCARYFCQDRFDENLLEPDLPENMEVIKDFSNISNAQISDIEIVNSDVYISDYGNGEIYKLNQYGDNSETIAQNLTSPLSISVSDLNELLFIQDNSDQVVGIVKLDSNNELRFIDGVTQSNLGDAFELDAYTVGTNDYRVYAITTSNLVKQMNQSGDSYGLPSLRMDRNDLNQLQDIEIYDGRIYLVIQDQGFVTYYGSSQETNTISGLPEEGTLDNVSSISIKNGYIYLGDSINEKIYELKMSDFSNSVIDFTNQYDLSNISGEIHDLVPDNTNTYLYVIVDNKLVKIGL